MTSIASLAMYDGGELTAANDALWTAIAVRLRALGVSDVPSALERSLSLEEVWSSGRLLFGQICGYPFASRFAGRLRVLGAPRYAVPDCAGFTHLSYIVVHAKSGARTLADLEGARAVINDRESMTGRQLLGDAFFESARGRRFFGEIGTSGSHAESLEMIASFAADVAAIDCVSYALLTRAAPHIVQSTRILHRTIGTPTLPFVISTELGAETAALVRRALDEAMADAATEEARRILRLDGVSHVGAEIYEPTLAVAARADQVL